jgi:hypothetical protein
LAKLMAELGWTAVRVHGLTRGGYLEQVRVTAASRSATSKASGGRMDLVLPPCADKVKR